jgi:NADP-dependent 3-hydroxy acid dehydrogenase YdfG
MKIKDAQLSSSYENSVQTILQKEGKIDVVINNACHLVHS